MASYASITDPIVSLYRVFHEMQTDMDMAVVITTVATVAGAVARAVKVRIVASFLFILFIYPLPVSLYILNIFRLSYRQHAFLIH